jgi:hypothetical protein
MEVGRRRRAGQRAVEDQVGRERLRDVRRAVDEPELFVDERLHGGARRIRVVERGDGAATRQHDLRIERERLGHERPAGLRGTWIVHAGQHAAGGGGGRCGEAAERVGVDEREMT